MIKLQQVDLRCKRVLLRADLNVSVEDGEITSEQRILASLGSVRYALENNAAVLIISHFGRPKADEFEARYSLVQVKEAIQNCLGRKVRLISDWINGFEIKPGEIALGENVRFLEGEVTCDPQLSQKMARLCDVFVMDAFGAAHRAHASISGIVEFAQVACLGLQCQKELDSLNAALNQPAEPLVAIVGGAKVDGKLQALKRLSQLAQTLIVGGGIANTFLAAQGFNVGNSLYDPELVPAAQDILDTAEQSGCEIPLPIDVIVAPSLNDGRNSESKSVSDVSNEDMILDIGSETRKVYHQKIDQSETIVWNGPVGAFEFPPFDAGTRAIASSVVESNAFSVAGGGDTLAALERFGGIDQISYVSTGGGAFLEYVQGHSLPGFTALQHHAERAFMHDAKAV